MKIHIYGLFDVLDPERKIVYIGRTENIATRLRAHVSHNRAVGEWIKRIAAAGSWFSVVVLESVEIDQAEEKEREWIERKCPELNCQLKPGWIPERAERKFKPLIDVQRLVNLELAALLAKQDSLQSRFTVLNGVHASQAIHSRERRRKCA